LRGNKPVLTGQPWARAANNGTGVGLLIGVGRWIGRAGSGLAGSEANPEWGRWATMIEWQPTRCGGGRIFGGQRFVLGGTADAIRGFVGGENRFSIRC